MKVSKHPLVPGRIRCPPQEGWSWIDRQFLRDFAERLERDELLLYFFLVTVSDREGLSYYSDARIAGFLHIAETAVARAREGLCFHDLIAYEFPLYQVLSLPRAVRRAESSGPQLIADIMREALREAKPLRTDNGGTSR
jgi:hypothetical protein